MEDKTKNTIVDISFVLTNLIMFFVLAFTGLLNLMSFNMIAFTLIVPFIVANAFLIDYFKKSKINFYYKKHVNICRVIAITLTVIICGSPIIMVFFNRTKPFYHLKQAVYSCGLRNICEWRTREFPDFLPWECEDYYFRIKAPAPFPEATDTYACVSFYTDKQTMKKYERDLSFYYLGNPYTKVFDDSIKKVYIEDDMIYAKNQKQLDKWYRDECLRVFNERIDECLKLFDDIPMFSLKIRCMKTRWGVNNVTRRIITLNSELLRKATTLIDYVIIHELCHFYEANHSSRFWKQVELRYPKYKEARKRMKVE